MMKKNQKQCLEKIKEKQRKNIKSKMIQKVTTDQCQNHKIMKNLWKSLSIQIQDISNLKANLLNANV